MIQILANLETDTAYTLHAHDGLDEVSLSSPTEIFELKSSMTGNSATFDPDMLGFDKVDFNELLGGDASHNAGILNNIMDGKASYAQQRVVELNAAFGIYVTGAAESLEHAAEMASESIISGRAREKMNTFIETSRRLA